MDNQLDRRRLMRNKVTKIIAIVIILIFGGTYMYNKLTKPNLGPKTAKLYQHGFRLLEEQIGTYIKEHYTGIEKIEFSPIYVTGDDGSSMLNAYVRPTIYDKYGNKATLGTQIKKYVPNSFGIEADLVLDFDWSGSEVIELLDSEDNSIDVSNAKELPEEAKLTDAKSIDINIQMLIEDGQLKDVVKDEKGSPKAQIIYNTKFNKGEE